MRRPIASRRVVAPDHVYGSEKVGRLINYMMRRGKKTVARRIVYQAFDEVKRVTENDPLAVFEDALRNVGPVMELRSRRVGGASYQIPCEVPPHRRTALALRWILGAAKEKKGATMAKRFAQELIDASKNEGAAVTKCANMQKMAEMNRAFAHLSW